MKPLKSFRFGEQWLRNKQVGRSRTLELTMVLILSQKNYILKVLDRFGMTNAKLVSV